MPRPSRRLDLVLVPEGADAADRVRSAFAELVGRGWITGAGALGPASDALVAGGFARARMDVRDAPVMWANQQGGVAVRCPACGAGLARALSAGTAPDRMARCDVCARSGRLDALDYRPAVAFGVAALVLADSADATLTEAGARWADAALGRWKLVWRRVG